MTIQTKTADNGVNVAALLGAREALGAAPEAARFHWRATSKWLKGTHTQATVHGFFGLGGEQQHRQTYQFDSDHPEVFASEDNGATPVEFMLGGCGLPNSGHRPRCAEPQHSASIGQGHARSRHGSARHFWCGRGCPHWLRRHKGPLRD